jgi:phage gp36-like protein
MANNLPDDLTLTAPSQPAAAPNSTMPDDLTLTAPAKPAPYFSGPVAQAIGNIGSEGAKVATGFVKGAGDTVSGISHLINKIPVVGEKLAPAAGIGALDKMDVSNSTEEMAGKGIENIAEFAAGDEALEGLSKASKLVALAKKYPQVAEVLNMAKEHPILSKIITGGAKAGTVGAAQGLVKGEEEGKPLEGTIGGAVGGTLGGATGATLTDMPLLLARKLGLGGLTSTEAMVKAGRPRVTDHNFLQSWDRAKPIIANIDKDSIKTVGDFEDALHNNAKDLWASQVEPLVNKYGTEVVKGKDVATQILNDFTKDNKSAQWQFPKEWDAAKEISRIYSGKGDMPLVEANDALKQLNATLSKYYKMDPVARHAIGMTDGAIKSYESAADALRDQIYGTIDTGEGTATGTHQALRQQYGALKDLERVFGKRAVVADRAAPLNFQQILGATEAASALLAGHPLVAAAGFTPWVAKARQAPESLIRQGIGAAQREATGAPAASAVIGKVLGKPVGVVGAEAGQRVSFIASDGSTHSIPADQIETARRIDPGLKVTQ